MVIVVKKSMEKIEAGERIKRLEQIAKEVLGRNFTVNSSDDHPFFWVHKKEPGLNTKRFVVSSYENRIDVYDKDIFDDAFRLAETYESRSEPEFTVWKQYAE